MNTFDLQCVPKLFCHAYVMDVLFDCVDSLHTFY